MIHPFEAAGLGKAPFRFAGVEIRECSGQPNAAGISIGSPGQPAGTCAYCGAGIKFCCKVRSADGKRFVVGSDCIERLDNIDRALVDSSSAPISAARREWNRAAAAKRKAVATSKAEARIEAARELLADPTLRDVLEGVPHPARKGETLAAYREGLFANAGRSGQLRAAAIVESWAAGPKDDGRGIPGV
jgi:hypothetical protein